MSSFYEYHKKWKKEKGITTDAPYRNLTDEEKAQEATKGIDELFENYMSNNITNKQKQISNSNQSSSNINMQRNATVWEQVNNIANNNFNNSMNISTILRNDNGRKGIETILNAKNRNTINDSVLQSKNNTIWNNITNNANRNMLFDKANQILPVQLNQENMVENLSNIDRKERYKQIEAVTPNEEERANLNLKVEEYLQSKKSREEAERINKDIEKGNYLSSMGHILKGVPEEAVNTTMKTVGAISDILPNNLKIGRNKDTDYAKVTKAMTKGYMETTSQINNDIVKTASSVSGSIGNMVPSILMNLAMPGSGKIVSALNVGGDSYLDTIDEDKGNKAQAILTALGKGGVTYGIEGLTGGDFLSKGSLDDIAKRTISNKLSSDLSKKIASKIYEFGGETLEENLENQLGYVIDKAINNKNISIEEWKNDFTETSKNTILTTGILNLLHLGGNTYKEIKQDEKLDDKSKDVLQEIERIIDDEKISINNKKQQTNLQQETINNQQNILNQQITQEQNNIASNANMEPIHSNYNETAKKYNIDINNNTVKGMYEVASKRGINIYYDDTVFSSSKQNAKWAIDSEGNRTVVINPNSNTNTTLQSIMIHELTHDIEGSTAYGKINEMVLNKLKQADNYDNMMLDIANTYKNEYTNMSKEEFSKMIEQEAVADYLGENLGNQEFVNELVKSQDKNTIQKIMDWVKNKITSLKNTVTGNQETNYWNKIKENFEKAYNQEFQRNDIVEKFSIQTDSNGNQYVKVDTDQDIFEGINKKDYNKIAKMYMQDYLLGNTKLSNNDNTIIDSRSANKYTNPKQQTQYMNEKMQLTPELKNVLEIAQKDSISLPTKENSKYRSWEYYKFNFELGRKQFEGTVNIGIDKDGNKHFYEINKIHTTSNSSVSTNKSSSIDSINNSILPTKGDVNRNTTKYSMQESENNSGSFNLPTKNEARLLKLKNIDTSNMSFLERSRIKQEIRALQEGFNTVEEYKQHYEEKRREAIKKYEEEQRNAENRRIEKEEIQKNKLAKEIKEATPHKRQQYEIIQYNNPMSDEYHVGIRSPKDILTAEEAFKNDGESFTWGDFSYEDAQRALKSGKVKIYSSKPIEQGNFVSTSKIQAEEYAGGKGSKVYEKMVSLDDIAWINGDEGQYAKVKIEKESKQTKGVWQQYLKDTSINKGTRETIKDIKLPIAEKYKNSNEIKSNNKESTNNENINEKVTRHDTIQKYRDLAKDNIKNISTWKDKSNGLKYQLETMERNMFDIIPDKAEAQKMNDTYFEPIHKAEAEKQKFINKYNNKIKEYNLNKYESEAVQFLGEQKYNPSHKTEDTKEIADRINKNIEKGKIDETKVNNAIETFRQIYDELFEIENNTLRKYGYQEKPYRKGYFPHFIDYVPTTKTEKVLDKLGFKVDKRELPTDIAGITEQFVPGKTWNQSALERKTDKTDYNALKGFDTYIQQASDNIFHTEDIQKLRGLENEIRYQYSEKGVQNRIDEILKNETLFQEEKQDLIDKIFAEINNPMPNLVTELRRYTNALANKKSEADRSTEQSAGRKFYNTVNAIESRFGANAVGLNIRSASTNFIPITQAYSQVSTKNMGRAFIDTVKSYVKDDGFVDKSTFLTNRLNQSERLYKSNLEKISDKTSFLFNAIDEVTSNIVVRGKYLENISEGMKESEALKNADRFAANVIADRSKGALPTKFEEKNPLTKMFTQFQLEVNNQYRYMFKDIPRDLKDKGTARIALAFFKMFVGAYLYNEVSEEITGGKSAFSPIDLVISSYQNITDSDIKTFDKISNISTDIGEQLPFIGGLLGGGKVPVNGAIPDVGNLLKAGTGLVTGEMDSKKAKDIIGKEVSKPLYYILPPFGGGQIKKSIEGIQTVKEGGSYGIDNKGQKILKFPVENASVSDYIKAGVFGKYALPLAKEYTNNKYKSLNAKETQGYLSTKIPYKEFLTYTNSKLTKKDDKIKFINNMNITEQQKWDMYCYDIFESETRKKDGGSQLEDAKYAIKNGISKKEYINLYNEAKKREIDMPTQDEGKELIKQGIKIKNYIDYSIKSHDETKKQKKNGTIKENGQLKSKDKINILLNSNYSEKEKKAIYTNYINKEDKKIILVDKLDFPLEQYLKYKKQGFKSEKDDEGESISGSKKKKVYNYLNEIDDTDLSLDYKKVICKIEGISSYDKDIVNFVNSQNNLTKTERIEILKNIGFKVDKEGRIKTTTMLPLTRFVK